ncbi:MAG: hypothetical protein COB54_03710 [Alphaproteobacteria bacterium]|nr:MAG: hypothetical protein COB54_03710 [Alphaproteobacteria bacterium]
MTITPQKPVKEFTGKKALMWIVGFFLVIFTVNAIMTTIAIGTWGGLETKDAYKKGLYYNDEIAAAEVQKNSGWDISLSHGPTRLTGDRIDVAITWPVSDLPPAKVVALVGRAVTDVHDQRIILTKTGSSIYSAPVTLPAAGQWNITILVKQANGPVYQLKEKIIIEAEK